MSESKVTTDHELIRKWVEKRGGRPVQVASTGKDGEAGILRLDFGEPEERLEEITWDEFFDKFEESELAFLYQEGQSRFNKLIRRDHASRPA